VRWEEVSELNELNKEELARLLEKAAGSPTESNYILILWSHSRPGEAFSDRADFEILYGEAEKVELERHYRYPHDDSAKYLIMPKTCPVVIRWWHKWDYGTDRGYKEEVYVFTKDGWKVVEVR
jgi:hypothetical protein